MVGPWVRVPVKSYGLGYPEATSDVMALAPEEIGAFYPPEEVAVVGDSENAVSGPKRRLPTALVVHCRGGGSVFAAEDIAEVLAATDAD